MLIWENANHNDNNKDEVDEAVEEKSENIAEKEIESTLESLDISSDKKENDLKTDPEVYEKFSNVLFILLVDLIYNVFYSSIGCTQEIAWLCF